MAEIESEHQNDKRSVRPVSGYYPNDRRAGGKDIQAEALGKTGSDELSNSGVTSGGHAGFIEELHSSKGGGR